MNKIVLTTLFLTACFSKQELLAERQRIFHAQMQQAWDYVYEPIIHDACENETSEKCISAKIDVRKAFVYEYDVKHQALMRKK